jgi:uncharacterized membrane protein YphA (DoxX/SURF4 family)
LIYIATVALSGKALAPTTLVQGSIEIAGAVFLLGGLWTPFTGTLIALDEAWIALSPASSQLESIVVPIFLAVLSASIAMLGPGAWSIDARLFGRKRFDIDRASKQ